MKLADLQPEDVDNAAPAAADARALVVGFPGGDWAAPAVAEVLELLTLRLAGRRAVSVQTLVEAGLELADLLEDFDYLLALDSASLANGESGVWLTPLYEFTRRQDVPESRLEPDILTALATLELLDGPREADLVVIGADPSCLPEVGFVGLTAQAFEAALVALQRHGFVTADHA